MSNEEESEKGVSRSQFMKEKEMAEEKEAPKKLSRKDFVKGAAAVAGVGALVSCAPAAAPTTAPEPAPTCPPAEECPPCAVPGVPETWDKEADVVIVGYGGAGAVAAITAADAGADVLILEKQPADTEAQTNHTNSTRLCYSAMMNFYNKEDAIKYLQYCSRGATPDDVIEAWAEYAVGTKDWIEGIGGTLTNGGQTSEYADTIIPGAYSYDMMVHENNGPGLWETLSTAAESRDNVEVVWETPGKELIKTCEGEILGVVADSPEGEITVKAKKAVILTTGGFEYDFELLNEYVYGYPCRFYGNPGNTGDGLRMAQKVGAALWHTSLIGGRVIPYFDELGYGLGGGTPTPFILVTKYGKRWVKWPWKAHSAWTQAMKFDTDLGEFPMIPCFSIFDDSVVSAGPLFSGGRTGMMAMKGQYQWSEDNSVEIEKGWVLKGETIEELASVIARDAEDAGKMKPEVLAETLSNYNQYCAQGEDPEFGRDPKTLVPLETPPYYALKMYPGGVNTFGGPKRNAKGQVVDAFNKAVPRLYSGGELGSILGFLYAGGGWNICELVVSGQIAGKNAAAEADWG